MSRPKASSPAKSCAWPSTASSRETSPRPAWSWTRDAEIDALNRKNYEELFGKAGDAAKVSASHVELIFISKALERIGDHSKNIAEQVIFLLSGEDVRHAR
jgi:phosphate uptake regulator